MNLSFYNRIGRKVTNKPSSSQNTHLLHSPIYLHATSLSNPTLTEERQEMIGRCIGDDRELIVQKWGDATLGVCGCAVGAMIFLYAKKKVVTLHSEFFSVENETKVI